MFLAEFLEVTPRCCQTPFLVNFDMTHGRAQRSASREIDVGNEWSSFTWAQANVQKLEMCVEGTSGRKRSSEYCPVGLAAGGGNEDGFHRESPAIFDEPLSIEKPACMTELQIPKKFLTQSHQLLTFEEGPSRRR
jgi:hypothetical protein